MHIYHYADYEPVALKRLMGRYATREDEIDRMLRAGLLVDLRKIAKQALRASVEEYSLKALEPFHGFQRTVPLEEARPALRLNGTRAGAGAAGGPGQPGGGHDSGHRGGLQRGRLSFHALPARLAGARARGDRAGGHSRAASGFGGRCARGKTK